MKTREWSDEVHFYPWIGEDFTTGLSGKQLLIVGESHYGKESERNERTLTQRVVGDYQKGAFTDQRARVFTVVARLLLQDRHASRSACREVWKSVAFFNYLQELKGSKSRETQGELDWETGKRAFHEVWAELSPDGALFLGKGLWSRVKPRLSTDVEARHIKHPSGGMSYVDAMPVVAELLAA